jgi:hypothetical protein
MRRQRLWTLSVIAATVAGLSAWAADEPIQSYFQPPVRRRVDELGYVSFRSSPADTVAANIKNAVVAYALLGSLVGVLLGVAGGLAQRRLRAAAVAAGAGLLVGAILTALVSVPVLLAYWWYFGDNALTQELLVPFLTHAAAWAPTGLAGGLALGLAVGGGRPLVVRSMVGGLIGAIVGALVYELAGAAVFPLDRTTFPVSGSAGSRLLARLAVAIGVAVFAVLGLFRFSPQVRKETSSCIPDADSL